MMYIVSDSCLIPFMLVTFTDYSMWGRCPFGLKTFGENLFCQISDVMQSLKNAHHSHHWAVSIMTIPLTVFSCEPLYMVAVPVDMAKGWVKGVCLQPSFSLISSLSVVFQDCHRFSYPPPLFSIMTLTNADWCRRWAEVYLFTLNDITHTFFGATW